MKKEVKVEILTSNSEINQYNRFYGFEIDDNSCLDIYKLDSQLQELSKEFFISSIDVNSTLIKHSFTFFDVLYSLIRNYSKNITVSTDLSSLNKGVINKCDVINVDYNPTTNNSLIISRLKAVSSQKIINLRVLDTFIQNDACDIVNRINNFGLKSFEIIQSLDTLLFGFDHFEEIIQSFSSLKKSMKFSFINLLYLSNIKKVVRPTIFITPDNNFGILVVDDKFFRIKKFSNINDLFEKMQSLEIFYDKFLEKYTSRNICTVF